MANKIFARTTPKAQLSRNAFDLSRKSLFTANVGELLPFFCMEVNPGDHVVLNSNSFTNTQPLNSAAYIRCKEIREFFFVPYRYLWSYWQQFITQVNDYNSTLSYASSEGNVPTKVPQISLRDLFGVFMAPYDGSTPARGNIKDSYGQYYANNFLKIFNLLEYGKPRYSMTVDDDNIPIPSSLLSPEAFNEFITANFNGLADYHVNPFRALAYQKIFYDYYRKSDWTPNNPYAYNIDFPRPSSVNTISQGSLVNMFDLHHRPWKLDYFMAVRPSTYWYGNSASGTAQSGIDNSSLSGLPSNYLNGTNFEGRILNSANFINLTGTLSTRQIKAAFAIDKMLRTTQKAGKHYDDQILAHFGVRPNSDIASEVKFIGSYESPLVINDVTSLADTTDGQGNGAAVGKQFGKGNVNGTSQKEDIVFDSTEHGILMGIYSCSLEADYNASGISPFNIKEKRADYYQPEFDDLGPHMLLSEFTDLGNALHNSAEGTIYGLVDPYFEYKIGVDKVFGEFMRGGNLEAWTAPRTLSLGSSAYATRLMDFQLYQNPSLLDTVFAVNSVLADQLFVNDYTHVSAVRNMSLYAD